MDEHGLKILDSMGFGIMISVYAAKKFGVEEAAFLGGILHHQTQHKEITGDELFEYRMETLKRIFPFFTEKKIDTLKNKFKRNGVLILKRDPDTLEKVIGIDRNRYSELVYNEE